MAEKEAWRRKIEGANPEATDGGMNPAGPSGIAASEVKPTEIKFLLFTHDLARTQDFYSALGMTWLGGQNVAIGKTGLPEHAEQYPELANIPHLWGDLGNNEFVF